VTSDLSPLRYDENEMTSVRVEVQPRPYEARIESGLLGKAGPVLCELLPEHSRLFVVTVPAVRRKWA